MQLSTTTDVLPAPRGAAGWRARLDRPAVAGLIALAGWLAFAAARLAYWAHGQLSLFIEAGTKYSHPALMFPRVWHVRGSGYDGQFYYRFAFDPFNWHLTAFGVTIDHPYRYTRIGYPVAAWLLSGGGHGRLLPAALVAVNLLCVAAMAWLGGVLARDGGRHALWGLLFAAYFGLAVSVGRDTSEPIADACLLGGLLAWRRARYLLAAALLGYAAASNEPVLVVPVALAAVRLWQLGRRRVRPGRPDLAWLVPGLVYLMLQLIQRVVVRGAAGGAADAAANLTWPFQALVPGVYRDIHRVSFSQLGLYDYNLIEFLAITLFVAAGFAVIRASTAPAHERLAFAGFVLLELVIASGQFWDSVFGDGRTFVDVYVMAVVLLLATPARIVTRRRLGWLAAAAVVVLVLVASRRVLAQLHAGDKLLHPFVDRTERVLAQHRPLRLVVQLEVHPVDGEVAALFLGPADELAPQLGAGGLRRDGLGLEDLQVGGHPVDRAVPL